MRNYDDLRKYLSKLSGQALTKEQLIDYFLDSKFEVRYPSMSVNRLIEIASDSGIDISKRHVKLSYSGKLFGSTSQKENIYARIKNRTYKTEPIEIDKAELQELLKHNSVGVLSTKLGVDRSTIYNKIRKFGLEA